MYTFHMLIKTQWNENCVWYWVHGVTIRWLLLLRVSSEFWVMRSHSNLELSGHGISWINFDWKSLQLADFGARIDDWSLEILVAIRTPETCTLCVLTVITLHTEYVRKGHICWDSCLNQSLWHRDVDKHGLNKSHIMVLCLVY